MQEPLRECDVIMKGGVTSGVVYPGAVAELSKKYRFRNIGGASAGAIAAALTAAAEYGRQSGDNRDAFADDLANLPCELGNEKNDETRLFRLFRPDARTRGLFDTLTAGIGKKAPWFHIGLAAFRSFPLAAIAGGLIGVGLLWGVLRGVDGTSLGPLALIISLVTVLLWLAITTIVGFVWQFVSIVPGNFMGLVTGHAEGQPTEDEKGGTADSDVPLTDWLHAKIQKLAGRSLNDVPLTFADLADFEIRFEAITTCLTLGRPYRLPFDTDIFYFDPSEFEHLFPKRVVEWMRDNPRDSEEPFGHPTLCLMPTSENLPIVVATRMSLSFPILLSAVPLYAVDYSRRSNQTQPIPERCWFSDGGISSNFPIHFFDSFIPRRPTFGLNLTPHHPDFGPDSDTFASDRGVYLVRRNEDGTLPSWNRFDAQGPLQRLLGFLRAIPDTGLSWRDTLQSQTPGYRDRIANIGLDKDKEGGLNLKMTAPVIKDLSERGGLAGKNLSQRFTAAPHEEKMSWDNHRRVRFLTTMALLETKLSAMAQAYDEADYKELLSRPDGEPPESYKFGDKRIDQETALEITDDLMGLVQKWNGRIHQSYGFKDNPPEPQPDLRVTPKP